MRASNRLALLLAVIATSVSACGDRPSPRANETVTVAAPSAPTTPSSVSVLVDLSKTWHNDRDRLRNQRIVTNVLTGIVDATEGAGPMTVRVLAIGANSLGRDPLCAARIEPTFLAVKRQAGLMQRPEELRAYLTGENGCTEAIFRLPTEQRTELTSAVVTAVRSDELADASTKRLLVILSDLKEEPISQETLDAVSLKGVQVLILYRALPEDQIDQQRLEVRLADWKQRLRARGATVQTAIDTAVSASGADVTRIIKTGVVEN